MVIEHETRHRMEVRVVVYGVIYRADLDDENDLTSEEEQDVLTQIRDVLAEGGYDDLSVYHDGETCREDDAACEEVQ